MTSSPWYKARARSYCGTRRTVLGYGYESVERQREKTLCLADAISRWSFGVERCVSI